MLQPPSLYGSMYGDVKFNFSFIFPVCLCVCPVPTRSIPLDEGWHAPRHTSRRSAPEPHKPTTSISRSETVMPFQLFKNQYLSFVSVFLLFPYSDENNKIKFVCIYFCLVFFLFTTERIKYPVSSSSVSIIQMKKIFFSILQLCFIATSVSCFHCYKWLLRVLPLLVV